MLPPLQELDMQETSRQPYDIAFVIPNFLHMPTGGDQEVSHFCKRLVEDGFSVAIVYLKDPLKRLPRYIHAESLSNYLRDRPMSHRLYYKLMGSYFGYRILAPLVRRFLKIDFKEDYRGARVLFMKSLETLSAGTVIAQSWETAFFVNACTRCTNKFYRVHHDVDDPSFTGQLSNIAAKSFELPLKKIVQNEHLYQRFIEEYPIRNDMGIETEDFPCKTPPENRNEVVLFPLRKNTSKGAAYAIKAAELIHEQMPDVKIMAFGNFPAANVPRFIDFRGIVPTLELVEIYNSSSVTAIASLVEGTSFPALESMSCGSALVSTDNYGVTSMVRNNFDCLIVPIMDPPAMASAVVSLLKDREKRISMAYNGIATSKKYSFDRTYEEFVRLIGLRKAAKVP